MEPVKTEPRSPLTDINNNISPQKLRDCDSSPKPSISKTRTTPEASPRASPKTLNSDCEDSTDEEVLPKGKRPPGAVRRRNERERNRVKHINRTFSVLRQHLPTRKANKKLSKVETLRSAVDYIKHLRQILADHDSITAAISIEQALIAHNQQLLHQHQLRQQQYRRQEPAHYARTLPLSLQYSLNSSTSSLDSSLCSPTGSVQSPPYNSSSPLVSPQSTVVSPAYQTPLQQQQQDCWEQNNNTAAVATDAELLELAAEASIADIDLW